MKHVKKVANNMDEFEVDGARYRVGEDRLPASKYHTIYTRNPEFTGRLGEALFIPTGLMIDSANSQEALTNWLKRNESKT